MSFGCVFFIKLTLHRNPDAVETPAFRTGSSGRCQRDYHQKMVDALGKKKIKNNEQLMCQNNTEQEKP